MQPIVLASTSIYRKQLLERIIPSFECVAPNVDESPREAETPWDLVRRLSVEKAQAVAQHKNAIVIGSDQVGALSDRILTKPLDQTTAVDQLMATSGRTVQFLTGLCVYDSRSGESRSGVDTVTVRFRPFSRAQAQAYVEREQPLDCAGSFKVEGLGIALFEEVRSGDPTSLEGLPLIMLTEFLRQLGADPLD